MRSHWRFYCSLAFLAFPFRITKEMSGFHGGPSLRQRHVQFGSPARSVVSCSGCGQLPSLRTLFAFCQTLLFSSCDRAPLHLSAFFLHDEASWPCQSRVRTNLGQLAFKLKPIERSKVRSGRARSGTGRTHGQRSGGMWRSPEAWRRLRGGGREVNPAASRVAAWSFALTLCAALWPNTGTHPLWANR